MAISIIEIYTYDLVAAVSVMTEPVIISVNNGKVKIKVDGLDIFLLDNANIWHTVIDVLPEPIPEKPEPEPYVEF